MYYIAYGSNLNIDEFKKRCTSAKIVGTSFLSNSKLSFNGAHDEYGYLTVKPGINKVPIAIYDISNSDVKKLDRYEGYPPFLYKKFIINKC